jgi:hypothetical protein
MFQLIRITLRILGAFPNASYCYAHFKELSSLRQQKNTPVPQAHID